MKRYYKEDGEPDEAKTLWVAAQKFIVGLSIFCGVCVIWNANNKPKPVNRTNYWKNWDSSRSLTEVKIYNYDTGMIEYRGDNPQTPREFKFKSAPGSNGLTIHSSGINVNLDMDVEELLEQMMDDYDFYEYLERELD